MGIKEIEKIIETAAELYLTPGLTHDQQYFSIYDQLKYQDEGALILTADETRMVVEAIYYMHGNKKDGKMWWDTSGPYLYVNDLKFLCMDKGFLEAQYMNLKLAGEKAPRVTTTKEVKREIKKTAPVRPRDKRWFYVR